MMKPITLYLIVVCALASCTDESASSRRKTEGSSLVCGKEDPLNELKWLKKEVSYFEGGPEINAVVLYSYQGRDVLELQGSAFSSTNIHQYYCDGEKLDLKDPDAFDHYKQNRIEKAVLYGTKVWD